MFQKEPQVYSWQGAKSQSKEVKGSLISVSVPFFQTEMSAAFQASKQMHRNIQKVEVEAECDIVSSASKYVQTFQIKDNESVQQFITGYAADYLLSFPWSVFSGSLELTSSEEESRR